jgi:hypothetical protein
MDTRDPRGRRGKRGPATRARGGQWSEKGREKRRTLSGSLSSINDTSKVVDLEASTETKVWTGRGARCQFTESWVTSV